MPDNPLLEQMAMAAYYATPRPTPWSTLPASRKNEFVQKACAVARVLLDADPTDEMADTAVELALARISAIMLEQEAPGLHEAAKQNYRAMQRERKRELEL